MQLVLDTAGLTLAVKKKRFEVSTDKHHRTISPAKISSIAVTKRCNIESTAIILAIEHQIPILFFNHIGKAKARLWSPYFESISTLRRHQVWFVHDVQATDWIIALFHLKTERQVQNLVYLKNRVHSNMANLDKAIEKMQSKDAELDALKGQVPELIKTKLLVIEAAIAKNYWKALSSSLPPF